MCPDILLGHGRFVKENTIPYASSELLKGLFSVGTEASPPPGAGWFILAAI